MTETLILYAVTAVLFLALDAAGLNLLVAPTFRAEIGHIMHESPKYVPALAFYLFYVVGVLFFVSVPALRADTALISVFLSGALLGAVAYGTYEFTNMATLKDWTWKMLLTDLIWGTVLTGTSAAAGLAITRWLTGGSGPA